LAIGEATEGARWLAAPDPCRGACRLWRAARDDCRRRDSRGQLTDFDCNHGLPDVERWLVED
jgi:hypothetical protein